jgi:hypothetical protein
MDCLVLLTYGSGIYDRLVNPSGRVSSDKSEHFKSKNKEDKSNIVGTIGVFLISLTLAILGFALPFYAMYLSLNCNDKHPNNFSKYGMAGFAFLFSFFYVIYYFIRYKLIGDKCLYA